MSTELAWAAGLFERGGSSSKLGGRNPRLQLKSTAEDSVRRFADAIDCGWVYGPYGPYSSQLGTKPYFVWIADGDAAAQAVERLLPYLSKYAIAKVQAVLEEI